MGDWGRPPRSHDDEPGEIEYGDFPDTGGEPWVDDDESVIDLDATDLDVTALDAGDDETLDLAAPEKTITGVEASDDPLREALFAAIADLDDEVDEEQLAQAPLASAAPESLTTVEQAPLPALEPEAAMPLVHAPPVVEETETPSAVAPVPVETAGPAVAPTVPAEATVSTPGEGTPVLPDWIYRIVLTLPLEMVEQIEELRAEAGIEGAPPPGIDLAPVFRTQEPGEVEAALDDWAQLHLPFELEIAGVVASVIGSQQYVAALSVEPDGELDEPYDDLMFDLDGLVTPLDDDNVQLAQIVVGSAVAAHAYPRLVARMQREIDLMAWRAESVMLIRREADAEMAEWQVVALFA